MKKKNGFVETLRNVKDILIALLHPDKAGYSFSQRHYAMAILMQLHHITELLIFSRMLGSAAVLLG